MSIFVVAPFGPTCKGLCTDGGISKYIHIYFVVVENCTDRATCAWLGNQFLLIRPRPERGIWPKMMAKGEQHNALCIWWKRIVWLWQKCSALKYGIKITFAVQSRLAAAKTDDWIEQRQKKCGKSTCRTKKAKKKKTHYFTLRKIPFSTLINLIKFLQLVLIRWLQFYLTVRVRNNGDENNWKY